MHKNTPSQPISIYVLALAGEMFIDPMNAHGGFTPVPAAPSHAITPEKEIQTHRNKRWSGNGTDMTLSFKRTRIQGKSKVTSVYLNRVFVLIGLCSVKNVVISGKVLRHFRIKRRGGTGGQALSPPSTYQGFYYFPFLKKRNFPEH